VYISFSKHIVATTCNITQCIGMVVIFKVKYRHIYIVHYPYHGSNSISYKHLQHIYLQHKQHAIFAVCKHLQHYFYISFALLLVLQFTGINTWINIRLYYKVCCPIMIFATGTHVTTSVYKL